MNGNLGPGPAGITQLQDLITRLINLAVPAAFFVMTIVIVAATIKFLTSGGEAKTISSASLTITWALLGILFLVLAALILRLIEAFTGVPVTQFSLCFPGSGSTC